MIITQNTTAEFPAVPGEKYIFSASGTFGGGTISLQWSDGTEWVTFADGVLGDDGTRVVTAPTNLIRLLVQGTTSPSLSAHVLPHPNGGTVSASDLGLGNVDNTSDAEKPVSNAQQAALELKTATPTEYFFATIFNQLDQRLLLAKSSLGDTWRITSGANVFAPSSGNLRDPSIIYYNGAWWVCFTAGGFGSVNYFSVITSTDLQHWTAVTNVSMSAATASVNSVWAPEWYYDGTGLPYVIVAVKGSAATFGLYYVQATSSSLTGWSSPTALTGPSWPTLTIDPYLLKEGSTYYLYFKDDTTKNIKVATSSAPFSGFTIQSQAIVANGEGACVIKLADGTFRMYLDGNGWGYIDSVTPAFTSPSAQVVVFPAGNYRHGTVLRLTDAALIKRVMQFENDVPNLMDSLRVTSPMPWGGGATNEAAIYFGSLPETQRIAYVPSAGFHITPFPGYGGDYALWVREISYDVWVNIGHLLIKGLGKTLSIKSGTNAKAGTFTLAAGAATVANTSVTANSVIICTLKSLGGSRAGNPDVVPTASTGFVATGGASDTSTYNYVILEVG
ncbi:hypothetical protein BH09VER1_BH09VER1_49010 [soil metagenome]